MPAGVNERIWKLAKKAAKKAGHEDDWRYVMGTYEKIKKNSRRKHK